MQDQVSGKKISDYTGIFFFKESIFEFNLVYDRNRIFGRNFRPNRPKYSAESFGQPAEYSAKQKYVKILM